MAKGFKQSKRVKELASRRSGQGGKIKPWLLDKSALVRQVVKPVAARANRWGAVALSAILVAALIGAFFWPKTRFRLLQERLAKTPDDTQAALDLAEIFLKNNQLKEAEDMLLLAENIQDSSTVAGNSKTNQTMVLGQSSRLEDLWQQKHLADPDDIRRLIAGWEKIVTKEPDYRDAYIQLSILYYKIGDKQSTKVNLQKAIELDPNYEVAKELENALK